MSILRRARGALGVASLMGVLVLAALPATAEAATDSTLTGQLSITAGLTGAAMSNTGASAPVPTMLLRFEDNDTVSGTLVPFSTSVRTPISGALWLNSWYSDVCLDTQTVTGSAAGGRFDRRPGRSRGWS